MKKAFYILSLLFLTLSVFGGSVFAAGEPDYYIDVDGEPKPIPVATVNPLTSGDVNGGWYYIEGAPSALKTSIYLNATSGTEVNVVVVGTSTLDLGTNNVIYVPENTTLNFWEGTNRDGTDTPALLTIKGSYSGFLIGNRASGSSKYNGNTDFGNITFNSGSYTVYNTTTGPAIGSSTASGGTITVNAAAEVTAYNYGYNSISVGVTDPTKTCTIVIKGGFLNSLYESADTNCRAYPISAGKGLLTLDNQGYIACSDTSDQTNWNLKSGIVATGPTGPQTNGTYGWGDESPWDSYVYGEVSIPRPQGVELTPPVDANTKSNGYYNTLTIDKDAQLTLGNEDQIAQFFVSGPNSIVNNNGDVVINSINQTAKDGKTAYTHLWNNNSGSTLTVNSGATLNIWKNGFNNLAPEKGQSGSPGEVTIEGTLTVTSANGFQNEGTLNIAQGGLLTGLNKATQVVGIAGIVNNPGGTVTLDGTIELLTDSNYSFQNSGNVNVGPIGQVATITQSSSAPTGGELTNYAGGTVTSQNSSVDLESVNSIKFSPV